MVAGRIRDGVAPSRRGRRTASVAVTAALAALLIPGVLAAPAIAAPTAVGAPVAVAVVVPLTVPAPESGLLDAEALGILTSPAGTLTRELDELLATSATIALDPLIVVSIRVLGTQAPESALDWLARLESASNEVFLLAYADADLSAFAREDALDLAAPLDFGFALDPAAFGPAQTATPTPTDSDGPTETPAPTETPDDDAPPPLPTTEELLAWADPIGRIAWPTEGSATAADLDAFAAADYEAVLLSSANLSETASAGVEVGGMPTLVADSAASELLRQASAAFDDDARRAAIQRLGTALDGLQAAHPGRTVVLTIDREGASSIFGFAETYAAIAARASAQTTGLADVLAGVDGTERIVDGDAGQHHAEMLDLTEATRAEVRFATILDDPLLLTAPRRLELLALLSVQDVVAPEWPVAAAAYLAESQELRQAVTIVEGVPILVTSTTTSIPIVVANGLEFPVTVRVAARPSKPLLNIEGSQLVQIEAGSSKTVTFDAQAVTNGEVTVQFVVSNPTDGRAIDALRQEARLEAQWETVGLVAGAALAVVFAVGIVRNVVLRRRRNRAAAGEAAE